MGATKPATSPTNSSGSKPEPESEPKKTNPTAANKLSAEKVPAIKTEVEEGQNARMAKQELTIKNLSERLDSHADASREILETIANVPQRLRDLEAEISKLKVAVAAAAEAALTKSWKIEVDDARAELKAAEAHATRGAEALSESMKASLMLNMRVQALEGLMQDVLFKTSALPPPPAKTASESGLATTQPSRESRSDSVPDSISVSFANGVPPLEVPRMQPLHLAHGDPGQRSPPAPWVVPQPPWAIPGPHDVASARPQADPMRAGLPMAPKLTGLLRDKPHERKGSCTAWW